MSEPLAQTDIEADLLRVNAELERVTHELVNRVRGEARAVHRYKVGFAQAFLRARASGESAAASAEQATVDTDELLLARLGAEAEAHALKEAGRNARAMGENLRSLNANLRPLVT